MSHPVCVVGSINLDMNAYVERFLRPGETMLGRRFTTGYGGKGANQAVMTARLGGPVTMIGRVGDDIFGQDMRANLAAEGIDTRSIGVTPATASGVAVITVDDQGQNTIIVIPGANHAVTPADITAARAAVEEAAVLVMQMELPLETNLAALRLAQGKALTLFNSAPISSALPDELYPLCDIFCPNETEIELLTGIAVQSRADAKAACQALLARGARNILLTMGERGSLLVNRSEVFHAPAPKVTPVDTVGAGDAFVGSLAHFLAAGVALQDAMGRANQIAAVSVQRAGAQSSYPRRAELPADLF